MDAFSATLEVYVGSHVSHARGNGSLRRRWIVRIYRRTRRCRPSLSLYDGSVVEAGQRNKALRGENGNGLFCRRHRDGVARRELVLFVFAVHVLLALPTLVVNVLTSDTAVFIVCTVLGRFERITLGPFMSTPFFYIHLLQIFQKHLVHPAVRISRQHVPVGEGVELCASRST